jgi:hypothetical protein
MEMEFYSMSTDETSPVPAWGDSLFLHGDRGFGLCPGVQSAVLARGFKSRASTASLWLILVGFTSMEFREGD